MSRERRIAVAVTALYLGVAAILFVLVFRTTGILWWEFRIDRHVDPPPALASPAPDHEDASSERAGR